jgi:hypothetical protein
MSSTFAFTYFSRSLRVFPKAALPPALSIMDCLAGICEKFDENIR